MDISYFKNFVKRAKIVEEKHDFPHLHLKYQLRGILRRKIRGKPLTINLFFTGR